MSSFPIQSGLAEKLDMALTNRGSASAVADLDLAELIELARTLEEAASDVRPSDEFRARSRHRLLTRMASPRWQQRSLQPSLSVRARGWAARLAAGLGALALAGAAAASASASALPGDALYPVKQVTEAAELQLAPTDAARQDVLLHQADTRLDETAQLLQQGRESDAATTVAQYEQTLAALPTVGSSQSIEPELTTDQARLAGLLQTEPGPARAGLERALSATERHTHPAVRNEPVTPPATATPASGEPPAPTEIADPPNRADRKPVNADPDVAAASGSDAPPPPEIKDSHPAPQADAKPATATGSAAPRGNAQPATAQPSRSAPERTGASPRQAPTGRGRP